MKDSVIEIRRRFRGSRVRVSVLRTIDFSYEAPLDDRVSLEDLNLLVTTLQHNCSTEMLVERLREIGEGFFEISEEVREWAEREVDVESSS